MTLNVVRKPVANRENSLTGALFGKQVLESLRSQVDAGTFYSPCSQIMQGASGSYCPDFSLYLGLHQVSLPAQNCDQPNQPPCLLNWPPSLVVADNNGVFQNGNPPILAYTVTCGDGSAPGGNPPDCSNPDSARRVDLTIKWPDAPS